MGQSITIYVILPVSIIVIGVIIISLRVIIEELEVKCDVGVSLGSNDLRHST